MSETQNTEAENIETATTTPSVEKAYLNYSLKRWILVGITAFAALFSLIGLAFSYTKVEALGEISSLTGFIAVFGGMYPAVLEGEYELAQIFAYIHFIGSIYSLYLLINSILKKDEQTTVKNCKIVWIIVGILAIFYSIIGTTLTQTALDAFEAEGLDLFVDVSTQSHILIIVTTFLYIGYQFILKFLPENGNSIKIDFSKKSTPAQPVKAKSSLQIAEELKKYKELLDCGAITQEEYDKFKSELMVK